MSRSTWMCESDEPRLGAEIAAEAAPTTLRKILVFSARHPLRQALHGYLAQDDDQRLSA
jgi:hypothetical protein